MTTFRELTRTETYYVGGMFPVGYLSCLVGDGGVGKSFVMMLASMSITSGRRFLPTELEYPLYNDREVMVIDTENRARSFWERLTHLGGDDSKYYTPKNVLDTVAFTDANDILLIEQLAEDDKTDLIIVDSLAGFNPGVEENTTTASLPVKWLGHLAKKHNKAIVITHFLNKQDRPDRISTDNMRGSSGIQQFCELIWAIDKIKDSDTVRRIYQIKNNITEIDRTVYTAKLVDGNFEFIEDIEANELTGKQRRIKIFEDNIDSSDEMIAMLLLQEEPTQQYHNLLNWVRRRRNKTTTRVKA